MVGRGRQTRPVVRCNPGCRCNQRRTFPAMGRGFGAVRDGRFASLGRIEAVISMVVLLLVAGPGRQEPAFHAPAAPAAQVYFSTYTTTTSRLKKSNVIELR